MAPSPSGAQYAIAHGPYRATIVEVGGGLRTLDHNGAPCVQGYDRAAICNGARGQLLLPWPNRIGEANYSFAGKQWQLPINEPARGCAIHGLTRWVNWTCRAHLADRVTLAVRLHPQPGWPGTLDLTVDYRLGGDGLAVTVTAHNTGSVSVPFGAGAHPYLTVGADTIDDWMLTLPASTMLTIDKRGIPTGRVAVQGTAFDFATPRPIGATAIDHAFTDLARNADGVTTVTVQRSGHAPVMLWADAHHPWLQIYTGDQLDDPQRRRTAIAIEPMTCPPDAFRSGDDLIILEPDDAVTMQWGIRVGTRPKRAAR